MNNTPTDGTDRQNTLPDPQAERRKGKKKHHEHGERHRHPKEGHGDKEPRHEPHDMERHAEKRHGHHHRGEGRSGGRMEYGELRLLVLSLLIEQPRHGYELIKLIEERTSGSYTPSPGVIYPTLTWLEDMGYTAIEVPEGTRKLFRVTSEGEAFLTANRASVEKLFARITDPEGRPRRHVSDKIHRSIENFKIALRLRLKSGPLDDASIDNIANALDAVVQVIEKS